MSRIENELVKILEVIGAEKLRAIADILEGKDNSSTNETVEENFNPNVSKVYIQCVLKNNDGVKEYHPILKVENGKYCMVYAKNLIDLQAKKNYANTFNKEKCYILFIPETSLKKLLSILADKNNEIDLAFEKAASSLKKAYELMNKKAPEKRDKKLKQCLMNNWLDENLTNVY